MQLLVVVKDKGQVKHFKFLHTQRTELGQRGSQHLHGAQLKRLHLFLVLVELAVRIDFHFDLALGALLGDFLEVVGGLAFRGVLGNDVAELDDDRCGKPGGRDCQEQRSYQQLFQFHGVTSLVWCDGVGICMHDVLGVNQHVF